jgi:hypothetical protein
MTVDAPEATHIVPAAMVVEVDAVTAGTWDWDTSALKWRGNRYGLMSTIDPMPCYRHEPAVVRDTLAAVTATCPPRWDVTLYLVDRESTARTNGHSDVGAEGRYNNEGKWVRRPLTSVIVMWGKRVPPHPAMTRYLVAHEYGHNVEWMLAETRGVDNVQDHTVVTEYALMRGLPTPIHYGSAGRWHDSAAEVFACDFRLVVCGVEEEYWPHPGVDRPGTAVRDWWSQALNDLRHTPLGDHG